MPDRITNQVGEYLSHSLRIKASHDLIGIFKYDRCVRLTSTQLLDCRPADQVKLGRTFHNRDSGAQIESGKVDKVIDHTIRTPGTYAYLGSDVFFSV